MDETSNLTKQQHEQLMLDFQEVVSNEIDALIIKALVEGRTLEEVGLHPFGYSVGPTLWDKWSDKNE